MASCLIGPLMKVLVVLLSRPLDLETPLVEALPATCVHVSVNYKHCDAF